MAKSKGFNALRSKVTRLGCVSVLALALMGPAGSAFAQGGMFSPVITVNGLGISAYEISQRERMIEVLGTTESDPHQAAIDALISDRLQTWEAKRLGLSVSDAAVQKGMEEFASRANLSAKQFIAAIGQEGVDEETFRDFTKSGLLWRQVVRAQFGGRISISDLQINRALAPESQRGQGTRVLLSELIIPTEGHEQEAMQLAEQATRGSAAQFADIASHVSASRSRENGGAIDWMPVANLPGPLRARILALKPGQATGPIKIPNAVAVFRLRAIDENGAKQASPQTVEYALYTLGATGSEEVATRLGQVQASPHSCDALYPLARTLPASRLLRESGTPDSLPRDISVGLSSLDPGEYQVLQQGGNSALLMLCSREMSRKGEDGKVETPNRDAAMTSLENRQIQIQADGLLADLRDAAVITRP
ncbi:SurA N-terminal domain-containing protein [Thioclava litoralis]|uniref:Parvulin-like PPIase n=2 Tax=Thioclava TaxID=285107 RepID=A0ABZ1DZ18_9RHOB|nr:SurA N-terminal domain-containing protein [Thioclava sp. FTW29]